MNKKIVRPGPRGTLVDEQGIQVTPPSDWAFLAAGDAGLTRKVTADGNYWRVEVRKGRRIMSQGVWASAETIEVAQKEILALRASDEYKNRLAKSRQRRAKKQVLYEADFCEEVKRFLNFAPCHKAMEEKMAKLITTHAVPVGSGTVARTAMIPIEERASRAVIAWMRHQTTAYEAMRIPREKGKRRQVRRMLAAKSVELLKAYRQGEETPLHCPLKRALTS